MAKTGKCIRGTSVHSNILADDHDDTEPKMNKVKFKITERDTIN